jgi:aminoglycoside phosphotransferase (APT) family kinase protein
MVWSKPGTDEIRAALQRHAPELAGQPITWLADGWEFWAFETAGYVLRLPKNEQSIGSLQQDRVLTTVLRDFLSVPVADISIWIAEGPNGAPFAGHRKLPGQTFWDARLKPGPRFGREFGRLLRELQAFPVERALELAVPLEDGPKLRELTGEHYETVIRRVFPLVSCEARQHVETVYEGYLNEASNFDFEPRLVHSDLDVNTLIEVDSGEITGVIDFGQAKVGSTAADYWLPVHGFEVLGIADQTEACLEASGIGESQLARMRAEIDFIDFRYPLLDILYGLDTQDEAYVEEGIRTLHASLPRGLICP